jgi:hypothetical protein
MTPVCLIQSACCAETIEMPTHVEQVFNRCNCRDLHRYCYPRVSKMRTEKSFPA